MTWPSFCNIYVFCLWLVIEVLSPTPYVVLSMLMSFIAVSTDYRMSAWQSTCISHTAQIWHVSGFSVTIPPNPLPQSLGVLHRPHPSPLAVLSLSFPFLCAFWWRLKVGYDKCFSMGVKRCRLLLGQTVSSWTAQIVVLCNPVPISTYWSLSDGHYMMVSVSGFSN